MKNLYELLNEAKQICLSLNIPINNNITIKYNGRIKNSWGYCQFDISNNDYIINIMRLLGEDDDIPHDAIMSIILHELLHTCPNCMNHGKIWKSYAKLIKDNYGYNIYKKCSGSALGIEPKYYLKCKKCKTKAYFFTKPRHIKYKCSICGSKKIKCYHKGVNGKELIWD